MLPAMTAEKAGKQLQLEEVVVVLVGIGAVHVVRTRGWGSCSEKRRTCTSGR
jgi:hypothetical protein